MVNRGFTFVCISVLVIASVLDGRVVLIKEGVNGGGACAACSIFLSILEKLALLRNTTVGHAFEEFCSFLPDQYKSYCRIAVLFSRKITNC
jgi:hypothetical protein